MEENKKRLDELDARLRQILEGQAAKRTMTPEHLLRIDQLGEDLRAKETQITELERALSAKDKEQGDTQSMIRDLADTNVQLRARVETLEAELKPYGRE